jgi:hypothetical protein
MIASLAHARRGRPDPDIQRNETAAVMMSAHGGEILLYTIYNVRGALPIRGYAVYNDSPEQVEATLILTTLDELSFSVPPHSRQTVAAPGGLKMTESLETPGVYVDANIRTLHMQSDRRLGSKRIIARPLPFPADD